MQSQTILILGAGAGVDIDMPTGESLSDQIAKKVDVRFEDGHRIVAGDKTIIQALNREAQNKRINANLYFQAGRAIAQGIHYTRSIDSYIHTHHDNEHVKLCAKIAIVHTIIQSEKHSKLFVEENKHPKHFRDRTGFMNSWLRDLVYILQEGITAKERLNDFANNIAIINFNYDRCIEHCLFRVMQELYLIDERRAAEIINSLAIFHPYGTVAPLPWQRQRGGLSFGGDPYGNDPHGYDLDLLAFAKNIRTFNEEVEEGGDLLKMRNALNSATNVVFLGFHFHKQNLALLKPATVNEIRNVYGSALNRSNSDIRLIERTLRQLFHPTGAGAVEIHLPRTDCKGIFTEYGATLGT